MVIDLIVSYTGVLAGIVLSIISPEELKPGRKYFHLAQWGMYGLLVLGGALLLFQEGRLAIALSVVGVGVLLGIWMECTEFSTQSTEKRFAFLVCQKSSISVHMTGGKHLPPVAGENSGTRRDSFPFGAEGQSPSCTPKEPWFLFEKRFRSYHYFLPYLLFTLTYFLISTETNRLLMTSGIFLYGFPTGTLARLYWLESQEKQTKS